ncbi:hypothetical protein GW17_00045807 [Ensete ventricosum]|nr:hypothetical protein GW17_00045807 [Ensete ventricosum]
MQLIIAGFFVCLDSFLSLLTIMPARIAMAVWRVLNTRWVHSLHTFKLHQIILYLPTFISVAFDHEITCALYLIQLSTYESDISLIYHFIRGQGTIKLYVVYNVLEVS